MGYCAVNGHGVAEGTITIPLVGVAIAELLVDVGEEEDGAIALGASVSLELGEARMNMAALRVDAHRGRQRVILAAGAGKLGHTVSAKHFDTPTAALVLKDTLLEVGEAPGALELPGSLPAWSRWSGPAYAAIRALMLEFPGYAWNVGPDGKVWAGKIAWAAGPAVSVIEQRPGAGAWVLEAVGELRPGVTLAELGGAKVGRVLHTIGPKLRTEVWTQ